MESNVRSPDPTLRLPLLGTISLKILTDAPISVAIAFAHLVAFYISESVRDSPFLNSRRTNVQAFS
jgi:hypothetical protein